MSPHKPREPHQERTPAPAWSPETEIREDVKALLRRRSRLTPTEVLLFRALYPELYDTYVETLGCVVRGRGATGAVESELVHDALATFWDKTVAEGFPESIQAKLLSLASGLASNHVRRERRNPAKEELPTSSAEVPGSFPRPDRDIDLKETARNLFDTLSVPQRQVIAAVIFRDLTIAAAAGELGLPLRTAGDRLTAALTLLRETAEAILTASERRL